MIILIFLAGFKFTGSAYYKMLSIAMKVALEGKNKIGFIDGTSVKPVTSVVLSQQWERCNAIILGWILGSNLLARDPLPDVKDAFAISPREESDRGLDIGKLSAKSHVAFVVRINNCNNNFNKRVNTNNNNNKGPNPNLVCKHYGLIEHTIKRCYELNGYPVGIKRNLNLSKHSGFVKKFSGNNVDVSQNASTSTDTMSSFTNEQMMKLLSLINEKHYANVSGSMVGFDKSKCYIQHLKLGKIVGTGSEPGGLYMFDCDNNGKSSA
nr:putative reverse transcriptase, RNA-dependent DNA polymerase, Gag-polypeptide of LTR copia-type [Tanacetum cinerariifolium]